MPAIKIEVLTADQLYERTRTQRCNADLLAEKSVDGRKIRRLHYLNASDYRHQIQVVLSLSEQGERIVGCAGLQVSPYDRSLLWVQHVSVEESYRGRGFARLLIEAVYAYALEQELKVSPSAFSKLGQALKPIFARLDAQYPQAASGESHRDHDA